MTSHLDYCNSLLSVLSGLPKYQLDRLQKVPNAAARVVCLVPKFNHTAYLKDLHWLPVEFRIEFKILLLVFKALNSISPRYICDLIKEKASIRSSLRSNDLTLLEVPRTKCKTFGDQAFAFAGPSKWNKLPLAIRTVKNLTEYFQETIEDIFVKKSVWHLIIPYFVYFISYFFVCLIILKFYILLILTKFVVVIL